MLNKAAVTEKYLCCPPRTGLDRNGKMSEMEIEQCRQKLSNLRSELVKLEESSGEGTQPAEPDQASSGSLSRKDACWR